MHDIVQIVRGRANAPYVLGGIIRNWIAADVALRAGCDGVVVFPHTFEEMMRHAGTDEWNATFRGHWDSMVEKARWLALLTPEPSRVAQCPGLHGCRPNFRDADSPFEAA